ncbi:MAG: hypothetical protein HY778_04275 [Betaproteobacteria bacterium]|nr:hypothetical protein [Betaproteobacteria bacterium]
MKIIGRFKERPLSFHARSDLLREGATFNTELQKLQSSFRFPRGVYRYKSHEDADRHWMECVVATVVAIREARGGQG